MKLIVGLGNPGKEYENTRHNVGYHVVELLAEKLPAVSTELKFNQDQLFQSEIAEGTIGSEKIILVKPQEFMNSSGTVVRKLLNKYRLPTTSVIIVHDDLTIDPGLIKISKGSGSGQHNGVQSIIDALKTSEFIRVRCGIGRGEGELKDMVLSRFRPQEKKKVESMIRRASEACICIVSEGIEKAMNKLN